MHIPRKRHSQHLDRRLYIRLLLYILITLLLISVVVYEIVSGKESLTLALLGILIGSMLGVIAARMFYVTWDSDAKKVIARLDWLGGVILVLYIILSVSRTNLISHVVAKPFVTGTSISFITGIMLGRLLGTGHRIMTILRNQKLLK